MLTRYINPDNNNEEHNNIPDAIDLSSKSEKMPFYQEPIRIAMNNRTISIYQMADYYNNIYSFSLSCTEFSISKLHKWCFILKSVNKVIEICPISPNRTDYSFLQEWNYDFHLFKYQCVANKDPNLEINTQKNLKLQFNLIMKKVVADEKTKLIKDKLVQEEINKEGKDIFDTAQLTVEALKTESKNEELILQEEETREKERLEQLQKLVEQEQKKEETFTKTIIDKKKESEDLIRQTEAKKQEEELKKQAQVKLINMRENLREKIGEMRKRSRLKEDELRSKYMNIRNEISSKMTDAYTNGDIENCRKGLTSEEERTAYCQAKFSNKYLELSRCMDKDDFCFSCCETEFGEMLMEKRKKCYLEVCPKSS